MKILLRENVRKLGTIGDIVTVKPGYARNYLLPQGIGAVPTEETIAEVEAAKAAYLAKVAQMKAELEARAAVINGKEITHPRPRQRGRPPLRLDRPGPDRPRPRRDQRPRQPGRDHAGPQHPAARQVRGHRRIG